MQDDRRQERERRIRGDWIPGGPAPAGAMGDPTLEPAADETLDRLGGDWRIFQLRRGHRYSTDDLLAAWYGCHWATRLGLAIGAILDLGCGIGSVGLLAAWRFPGARLTGIEAQERSAGLARRSYRYNGLQERGEVRHGDLRDPALLPEAGTFDLVFGSPPYLPRGTGSVSLRPQCEPCRFETRGGVEGYCEAIRRALAPEGLGALVFTWRDRERVLAAVAAAGLSLLAQRAVITRAGQAPLLDLLLCGAGERAPLQEREPPALLVRQADGRRSEEMGRIRVEMGFPPERTGAPT